MYANLQTRINADIDAMLRNRAMSNQHTYEQAIEIAFALYYCLSKPTGEQSLRTVKEAIFENPERFQARKYRGTVIGQCREYSGGTDGQD